MTWRVFLSDAKKIAAKLDVLELRPEYYEDPLSYDHDPEIKFGHPDGWHLYDDGEKLFISEGNHRSVVAKFRAHEDGITSQRVYSVIKLKASPEARRAYANLQHSYLPFEADSGPERRLISDENGVKLYQIRVRFWLLGFGGPSPYEMEIHEAAKFVERRNRWRKKVFNLVPNLYRKLCA
ncbi:hypothetical protein C8029_06435 [Roseobacter sp. TSBP12]|nr:hypothetical protein C8029_06435 [Roseobacter sp. TSBP12]